MVSRALLLASVVGTMLVAACTTSPFQETANYSRGYEAACANVDGHASAPTPIGADDTVQYDGNRDYRSGWDDGIHCRDDVPFTG